VEARIVAVVDAFDAMTTNRAYRPQLPVPRAVDELRRCAGVHFDAEVVEAFLGAYNGGSQLPIT
jgi:HD-GYP domain-containing protein (c-di-GMP phosphodiesterase class II)